MSEAEHQRSFFRWLWMWTLPDERKTNPQRYPELHRTYHCPNGGLRDKRAALRLKHEGVRPGILDLHNWTPRKGFHGLWIENKVLDNKPTQLQQLEIETLRQEGHSVHLCYCWSEVARLHLWYFDIQDRQMHRSAGEPHVYLVPRYGGHNERCGCGITI